MKESRCGYHSKVCMQVVSTARLFEILASHYFYTVLLERNADLERERKTEIQFVVEA